MARPKKVGLDYFPLDVDIDQDDKVAIIEAQHGMIGFSIVIKLLMKIYSEGYYYDWTEKEQILFSRRVNVDINDVNIIMNDCIKWGLFDEELFNEHKILTSKGIQLRYFEAVKRRQRVEIAEEFLLLDEDTVKNYSNLVIVSINEDETNIQKDDVNINLEDEIVNVDTNPQSKVKESKVKDSNSTTTESDEENIVDDVGADPIQRDISPVAPVGSGPTKQDYSLKKIEDYYLNEVRQRATCSGKDLSDMFSIYGKYKDIDFILDVLKSATKDNIRRNGKCKINSFSYFIPILEDRWKEKNEDKEVEVDGAGNSESKSNTRKTYKFTEEDAERAGVTSL